MISYHSHSGSFCCHAVGTLEQVVTTAIEKNFTSYGLSEHVPRYREVDLYPEEVSSTSLSLSHISMVEADVITMNMN
jgi:histidinol-phosphatase (PHP family)